MNTHSLIAPFSLDGPHVQLDPLRHEHAPMLWDIVKDHLDGMFRWIPYRLESLQDFEAFSRQVLDEQQRGLSIPFATFERSSNRVVGTLSLIHI